MESYFNNKGIFGLISKWKYHIIIIVVIALIAGYGVSYLLKPKFKSFATVYPVNLSTLSDESETEQMLQILRSQDIKERLYKELGLDKHYGLNPKEKHFKANIFGYLDENISYNRTEFESVEIVALDVNPQVASNIVDSIITFYNDKVADLHRIKYKEVVEIAHNEMKKKENEIGDLNTKLENIRKEYGILDYKVQTREATRAYNSSEMKKLIENLKEKGGEYTVLDSLLWNAHSEYLRYKQDYEVAQSNYEKEITYCHVVSRPYPADKKSKPIRGLIAILAGIGALFMSVIIISVLESAKKR